MKINSIVGVAFFGLFLSVHVIAMERAMMPSAKIVFVSNGFPEENEPCYSFLSAACGTLVEKLPNSEPNSFFTWHGTKWLYGIKKMPCGYEAKFSLIGDDISGSHEYYDSFTPSNIPCAHVAKHGHISIAFHPIRREILYPSGDNTFCIVQEKEGKYEHVVNYNPLIKDKKIVRNALYSSDGEYIALLCLDGTDLDLFLYHPTTNTIQDFGPCLTMVCMPHWPIIAMLMKDAHVQYVNSVTGRIIAATKPLIDAFTHGPDVYMDAIFFTPDNLQLVVVVDHKCNVLEVPFDKLFSGYCLLQQYNHENNKILSQDIIQLLTQHVLALYF